MVWNLLFRRFAQASANDDTKGQQNRLSKQDSIEMMHFLAHTILKGYNLEVLKIAMTDYMKQVMASDDWKAYLKSLKEKGVTGAEEILKKKDQILGAEWDGLFAAGDVGNSGKLSWETQQFRVFVKGVFVKTGLPEHAGGEEVNRKMFDTFAPEGSDIINKDECKLMVGTVMDAVAFAMQQA